MDPFCELLLKWIYCANRWIPNAYWWNRIREIITRKAPSFDEVFVKDDLTRMRQFYEALLNNYPDVLSVRQVAQFTGYGEGSVAKWCSKQELKSFFIRQKFKIPKEYFLDFLVSRYFIGIAVKSEKHQKFNEQIRRRRLDDNCIIVD